MVYPIVAFGDPVLRRRAQDIPEGTDLSSLVGDMFDTMYNANGVGLAAPQIGKSIRIFVVDGEPMGEDELKGFKKVFVNPTILNETGEPWAFEEGCLSIPNVREDVEREEKVVIEYFDENWVERKGEFEGLQARIIQHEYDHLEGVLFTDHLSSLKKRLLKGKLSNISKGKVKIDYTMKFPIKG